jgi:hypothetical protein
MTTQQVLAATLVYSVALALVVSFTRPTARRFAGALAGAAAIAGLGLSVLIPLGEARGCWRVPLDPSPSYMTLFYLATIISTVPIFLVTWRIARRFGWRGLAVTLAVAPVAGPPREFASRPRSRSGRPSHRASPPSWSWAQATSARSRRRTG